MMSFWQIELMKLLVLHIISLKIADKPTSVSVLRTDLHWSIFNYRHCDCKWFSVAHNSSLQRLESYMPHHMRVCALKRVFAEKIFRAIIIRLYKFYFLFSALFHRRWILLALSFTHFSVVSPNAVYMYVWWPRWNKCASVCNKIL